MYSVSILNTAKQLGGASFNCALVLVEHKPCSWVNSIMLFNLELCSSFIHPQTVISLAMPTTTSQLSMIYPCDIGKHLGCIWVDKRNQYCPKGLFNIVSIKESWSRTMHLQASILSTFVKEWEPVNSCKFFYSGALWWSQWMRLLKSFISRQTQSSPLPFNDYVNMLTQSVGMSIRVMTASLTMQSKSLLTCFYITMTHF